jgi:hypothetical protein
MLDSIYTAVRARLLGDAALIAALGGDAIYAGIAPPGITTPYVIMLLDGGGAGSGALHTTAWPSLDARVRVVAVSEDAAEAGALAGLIRARLDGAALDLGAPWGQQRCQHRAPLHDVEAVDRRLIITAGGVYRLRRASGTAAYIAFGGVDLSPRCIAFDPGLRQDFVELTAGGDALRWYAPTARVAMPTMRGLYDPDSPTGAAIIDALAEGNEATLQWGVGGATPGEPRWGIAARVARFNVTTAYDGEAEFAVEWINRAGAFVYDGRTATW